MQIGVNNIAKKVSKIYIGINGIAKTVNSIYCGIENIAKKIFSSEIKVPNLFEAKIFPSGLETAAISSDEYLIIAGGDTSTSRNTTTEAYDENFVHYKLTDIYERRDGRGAGKTINHYIYHGGYSSSYSNMLETYEKNTFTYARSQTSGLPAMAFAASAEIGEYLMFAGGRNSSNIIRTVQAINDELTVVSGTNIDLATRSMEGVTIHGKAFIGGGFAISTTSNAKYIYVYDDTLTKVSTITQRFYGNGGTRALSNEDYAFFMPREKSNYLDAFDRDLTVRTVYTSESKANIAKISSNNYAVLAGGTIDINKNTYVSTVEAFDKELTLVSMKNLKDPKEYSIGGRVGKYGIVAGGRSKTTSYLSDVEVFNLS